GLEVSWQVTGIRHDAHALAHPIVVEERKGLREMGRFMEPSLYGQPPSSALSFERQENAKRAKSKRR
ncbi:MAG TPA: hypothetical protein VF698_09545, partial [Thermoanaerobaculia bacterium]